MGRLSPDRVERDGLHKDYYWPGEVHSVWNADGWLELRRERKYRRGGGRVTRIAWQLTLRFGPHTIGWRWEFATN